MARSLLGVCALAGIAVALTTGCGSSDNASDAGGTVQRDADLYQIDRIEEQFHRATSTQNLKLMMSLFAPGAVFNVDQKALTGKPEIRQWFATDNKAFKPGHHWESDTPSYKLRSTVNGNKGTLYFECHYIDTNTHKVVAYVGVDHDVQKIKGKWLIVDSVVSKPSLSP